jgi:hypothetical protein
VADPTARAVILGASNVSRGTAGLIAAARSALGGPVEFLVARGHGRSYGAPSRVLGRGLPGIVQCGLWEDLEARGGLPTRALVTDVGNDVMYGAAVDEIAGWVRLCLDRLAARGARTVLALPPMESLARLQPWRFHAARSLLFPGRRLTLGQALDAAGRLATVLRSTAADFGAAVVDPPGSWYGLDPIHPRRRHLGQAWRTMLAPWTSDPLPVSRPGLGLRLRLAGLTPQRWSLAGVTLGRRQPAARLHDGSSRSFY